MPSKTSQENNTDDLYVLAGECIAAKEYGHAELHLRKLLEQTQTADIYHRLGVAYFLMGEIQLAVNEFGNAIGLDAKFHKSYASLGEILKQNNNYGDSATYWAHAVNADPNNQEYIAAFLFIAQYITVNEHVELLERAMLHCLQNDNPIGIEFPGVANFWFSILQFNPKLSPVYQDLNKGNLNDLLDPLFLLALQNLLVSDIDFENFLVNLRQTLLLNVVNGTADDYVDLIKSLASYCSITEYIFACSDEEFTNIEKLQKDNPLHLAMLSCYQAITPIEKSDIVIESITDISSGTSADVREQYEVFPYPKWSHYVKAFGEEPLVDRFRGKNIKMLIAGCGTGCEAISMAAGFPDGHVTAVDLSKTSLSYAIEKAEQHNIKNISFKHGDILKLGVLDEQFDYVASSGVLHHMKDPIEGWRVITNLLKPDGLMMIALYSKMARRNIIQAQDIIKQQGYSSDAKGMKEFRQDAENILPKDVFDSLKKISDYYNISECRDLLFHVQEHCYELPEIKEMMDDIGLKFIKMGCPKHILVEYQKFNLFDTEGSDLMAWHRFELANPDMFIGMYQFWCQKNSV